MDHTNAPRQTMSKPGLSDDIFCAVTVTPFSCLKLNETIYDFISISLVKLNYFPSWRKIPSRQTPPLIGLFPPGFLA